MIDNDKFQTLKQNVAFVYAVYGERLADRYLFNIKTMKDKVNFIFLTRSVKTLDLANVRPNATQILDGYKDYDEVSLQKTIDRINLITNSGFILPIIHNNILDNG